MRIFAVLFLVVAVNAQAEEPENLFVIFSKCAGVLQSEVSDTNKTSLDPAVLSNIVSNLKKAALIEDSSKSLNEYYRYKDEGNVWYQEVSNNEDKKSFLMYLCANAAQDAMDLVKIRGR